MITAYPPAKTRNPVNILWRLPPTGGFRAESDSAGGRTVVRVPRAFVATPLVLSALFFACAIFATGPLAARIGPMAGGLLLLVFALPNRSKASLTLTPAGLTLDPSGAEIGLPQWNGPVTWSWTEIAKAFPRYERASVSVCLLLTEAGALPIDLGVIFGDPNRLILLVNDAKARWG